MKKEFLPYYISRAILSSAFAILIVGIHWMAALFAAVLFGLFLLYLHSGWFSVDPRHPLTPLRRDPRGQEIQRKALLVSIVVGMLIFSISSLLPGLTRISLSGDLALAAAVITYFIIQFVLFART